MLHALFGMKASCDTQEVTPPMDAALSQLLSGRSVCDTDIAVGNVTAFRPVAVAVPASIHNTKSFQELISTHARVDW